jgi:hypothetical protein
MWRWLLVTVGWLVMFGIGMAALLLAIDPHEVPLALSFELERLAYPLTRAGAAYPWALVAVCWGGGVLLLVMCAFALAAPFSRLRRSRLLEFPTDSGRVQVDIGALEECLAHMVSEEDGVLRARVWLRGAGRSRAPLGCTAEVWFEAGPDVIGRVAAIQQRMRAYYYQVLPVKDDVRMDVRTRLIYRRSGARSIETHESGRTIRPSVPDVQDGAGGDYSGPRYPTAGNAITPDGDGV